MWQLVSEKHANYKTIGNFVRCRPMCRISYKISVVNSSVCLFVHSGNKLNYNFTTN